MKKIYPELNPIYLAHDETNLYGLITLATGQTITQTIDYAMRYQLSSSSKAIEFSHQSGSWTMQLVQMTPSRNILNTFSSANFVINGNIIEFKIPLSSVEADLISSSSIQFDTWEWSSFTTPDLAYGDSLTFSTITADVSGYWKLDFSDGETAYINLTQTGSNITGQGYCVDSWDGVSIAGSLSGNSISLQGTFGTNTYPFSGTINGTSIEQGTFSGRPGSRRASLTWTGSKQTPAPTAKECIVAALDVYVWSNWMLEAHIYDPAVLISSVAMTGSYLSSAATFTYNATYSPTALTYTKNGSLIRTLILPAEQHRPSP